MGETMLGVWTGVRDGGGDAAEIERRVEKLERRRVGGGGGRNTDEQQSPGRKHKGKHSAQR